MSLGLFTSLLIVLILVCLCTLQFSYCITHYNQNKTKTKQKIKTTNKFGSLSRRLLNWLTDGAFFVHGKSEFQVGATLLLKANFLVLVSVKRTHSLCSEFLVLSCLVVVKKSSNFKSSISLIILNTWIRSPLYLLYFKVGSFNCLSLSL